MAEKDFIIERTILKIGNHVLNVRSDDLKSCDLTSNQSETLLFFELHEGALILDLKEHLKISHQAARNIVERMKAKGLLYVTVSHKDARAKQVFLSEKGKSVCKKLKEQGGSLGGNLLQYFTEKEKDQLLALLEKIIRTL